MPLARDVVKDIAVNHGGCIRPVQLRRTDLTTGISEAVLVPCGHTLASVCPACAERNKNLRAGQLREGWHLEHEPDPEPDPATESQEWWIETRADWQARRDDADSCGEDTSELDELLAEIDEEINGAGMRGKVLPASSGGTDPPAAARTPRRFLVARSTPARPARPTPHRTARRSGPRCSSPSPARPTAR
jgi:hypothetical protein